VGGENIGAYDAKTHLPRLLDEVATGKSFTITKHGVPVARLVAVQPQATDPAEVVAALRAARAGVRRGDLSVRDMIEEGRA
jgi:prevent-host-death family protein